MYANTRCNLLKELRNLQFEKLNFLIYFQNVRGLLSKLSTLYKNSSIFVMLLYLLRPGLTHPYTIMRFCLINFLFIGRIVRLVEVEALLLESNPI